MSAQHTRSAPLYLVASDDAGAADALAARLRGEGMVAYAAHSSLGLLRMATSVSADVVLLDGALSRRLESLLRAHPASAGARVVRLADAELHLPATQGAPLAA